MTTIQTYADDDDDSSAGTTVSATGQATTSPSA